MFRVVNYIAAVVVLIMQLLTPANVAAELMTVPTAPLQPTSPLIITAYQASTDGLDLVQVYNNSDDLVLLDGMALRYSRKTSITTTESIPLSGRMLPGSHILLAAVDVLPASSSVAFRFSPSGWEPKSVWIESPEFLPVTIPGDVKTDAALYKRSRTTTGYSTAATALNSPLAGSAIEADRLYEPPEAPKLQIVEILSRSKSCSPFDEAATCSDYIKLRMKPGFDISDLPSYRVRTGTDESVANTFSLLNTSIQNEYLLLRLRDDGNALSLTNSGGYIWVEDAFGIMRYEDTLVEYADAGSEDYIDQSWGLNDETGAWQWATPNPTGSNIFPVAIVEPAPTVIECPAGKYRNPETNRCRSIEEAVSELAACEEGKERNPATNRCRSVVTTAVATLTPCGLGEERNPLTNRCRQVLAASQPLVACGDGEQRNPDTNRCRKVSSASASTLAAVTDIPSDMKQGSTSKWWIAGVVILFALGYAVYEWRQEILLFGKTIPGRLHLKK